MHFCRVLFLFCLVIFSPSATAQQNIFNVPSSDITAQTKLFFQEQLSFIQDGSLLLNTTFCYGLGREWEIGLNVLGIYIEPGPRLLTNSDASKPPLYPFYTINAQKAWKLSKVFKMAVGTQTGLSNGGHFGTYNYLNVVTALPQYQLKLITGFNVGTESFLGYGDLNPLLPTIYDPVGYQVGIEKELIYESCSCRPNISPENIHWGSPPSDWAIILPATGCSPSVINAPTTTIPHRTASYLNSPSCLRQLFHTSCITKGTRGTRTDQSFRRKKLFTDF